MEKFADKNTMLSWINSQNLDRKTSEKFAREVNSWSSNQNIKTYITTGPLDDFLNSMVTKSSKTHPYGETLYYCFENDKLVGAVLLGNASLVPENYSIDYIVVNPNFHSNGIGTRMIKSIVSNPNYFNNFTLPKIYNAHVAQSNVASCRAFLKSKFSMVKPTKGHYPQYYTFYSKPQNTKTR